MFVSSLVDLRAFFDDIVGIASTPSIAIRVFIGVVILWLIPRRRSSEARGD
jgi:hypothetical protein